MYTVHSTLVCQIEVQAQINVQVGEFLKIDKRAVQNKLVLKELEWFFRLYSLDCKITQLEL
jgi:hypothetical protein